VTIAINVPATDHPAVRSTFAALAAAIADPEPKEILPHDAAPVFDDEAANAAQSFFLGTLRRWASFRNGGNQWSGGVATLSFFRYVANLDLDYATWDFYEKAAIAGGPRFSHADFWICSDFPTVLKVDERNLPHSANGPAVAWTDGWELFYWRGTRVPKAWIVAPATVDPSLALTHPNAEQRRCLSEILGWDKVLAKLNPVTIDKDPDPLIGELIEVELMGNRERFIRVQCGTGRTFALPVPPEMKTALQANAWTQGLDEIKVDGTAEPGALLRKLEIRT